MGNTILDYKMQDLVQSQPASDSILRANDMMYMLAARVHRFLHTLGSSPLKFLKAKSVVVQLVWLPEWLPRVFRFKAEIVPGRTVTSL